MDGIDLDFGEDSDFNVELEQIKKQEQKPTLPCRRPISPPRDGNDRPFKSEKKAKQEDEYELSADEMYKLHNELTRGSENFVLRCIVAKGVDDMSPFDLEKVFASYRPYCVEVLRDATALLHYASRQEAAVMLLNQTKRLRRVRQTKLPEEDGELADSDEEGELQDANNDQVEIINRYEDHATKKTFDDCVKVDVGEVQVPDGPWRVVTDHVPDRRLMLVRFASIREVKEARNYVMAESGNRKRKADHDEDGFSYKWSREDKVRPGLNVFTDDGKELEWDYEHDTRFYKDLDTHNNMEDSFIKNWGKEQNKEETSGKPTIKVRGRGAARAHLLKDDEERRDTMRADAEPNISRKRMLQSRVTGGCFDGNSEDQGERERLDPKHRDPSPTPQPWDRKERKSVHSRITF